MPDDRTPDLTRVDDHKGVIEEKKEKEPDGPFIVVQVPAKFVGDWQKFLMRNLNPQVAIDNGVPAGTYDHHPICCR